MCCRVLLISYPPPCLGRLSLPAFRLRLLLACRSRHASRSFPLWPTSNRQLLIGLRHYFIR